MQSVIEVAPFYNQIYSFGDYLVEQVQSKPNAWGNPGPGRAHLPREAGGRQPGRGADRQEPRRRSGVSGPQARQQPGAVPPGRPRAGSTSGACTSRPSPRRWCWTCQDPDQPPAGGAGDRPRVAGALLPLLVRDGRLLRRLLVRPGQQLRDDRAGLRLPGQRVALGQRASPGRSTSWSSSTCATRTPRRSASRRSPRARPTSGAPSAWSPTRWPPAASTSATARRSGETTTNEGLVYTRYRYYAQRWEPDGETWVARQDINTPGRLVRTWRSGGWRADVPRPRTPRTGR